MINYWPILFGLKEGAPLPEPFLFDYVYVKMCTEFCSCQASNICRNTRIYQPEKYWWWRVLIPLIVNKLPLFNMFKRKYSMLLWYCVNIELLRFIRMTKYGYMLIRIINFDAKQRRHPYHSYIMGVSFISGENVSIPPSQKKQADTNVSNLSCCGRLFSKTKCSSKR